MEFDDGKKKEAIKNNEAILWDQNTLQNGREVENVFDWSIFPN